MSVWDELALSLAFVMAVTAGTLFAAEMHDDDGPLHRLWWAISSPVQRAFDWVESKVADTPWRRGS